MIEKLNLVYGPAIRDFGSMVLQSFRTNTLRGRAAGPGEYLLSVTYNEKTEIKEIKLRQDLILDK